MPWLLGVCISGVHSFRATPGHEGAWLLHLGAGLALLCCGFHSLVGCWELYPVTHVGRTPTASM